MQAGGRAKLVQERARLQEQLHQRQDAPDILPPRKQGGLKKASFDEGSIQTDEKKKKGRRASFELPGEETTKPGMNGLPIPDPGREPTDQGPKGSYDATAPSTLSLQKLENVEKGLKSGEASRE
ncbi:hypothetical protein DUNSADRAFT_1608 [Dunaliella salina]|uniref:Encoded protein n=1 Tax=Dunaliella salina TaxID=3046 RepID=A0ABQ7H8J5_DUNSA|nr:hypothetical protein DUNSADRAFT_1608 [Dunaliella salina]|eukprot:KAF5843181.1 hypothetical protein DUNSADRAFT_1608 [Dunaliella salina]